jgi:hypothetical protein
MAKQIKRQDISEEDLFKSVRDSAESTLKKINELNFSLKESAAVLKKDLLEGNAESAKGIEKLTQATNEARKAKEAAVKLDQEQIKVEQQLIKMNQELEKLEQQKIKTEREAIKNAQILEKEQQKAIKASQDETNVYKQKSALLNTLRNEYKNLAAQNKANTAEAQDLLNTVSLLDDELKAIDQTVGQHQRNVGNYESATKSLKLQLRELTQQLQQMDQSDPRFQQMAQEAAVLKDQIDDTGATIRATTGNAVENLSGSFLEAGKLGVAAFQGVEASMQLMGVENENVLEGMRKLAAISALSDSLKALGELDQKYVEIKASLTAAITKIAQFTGLKRLDTVATVAQAGATTAQTTATTAATTATRALSIAMKTLPIVAIIGGLIALASNWSKISEALGLSSKRMKEFDETQKEAIKGTADLRASISEMKIAFEGARQGVLSKEKALEQYNEQFGDTLGFAKDLNEAEELFSKKTGAYIQATTLRAQAQALLAKAAEESIKALAPDESEVFGTFDKIKTGLTSVFFGAQAAGNSAAKTVNKNVDDLAKSTEKRSKIFTDEAERLLLEAMKIESQYDLNGHAAEKAGKKTVKEVDNTTKQLAVLQAALRKTTNEYQELRKVSRITLDPDEVERALALENERLVLAADIAVIEAEIALSKATQSGDVKNVLALEQAVLEAKKKQIQAQLKLDLSTTDNVNEQEKLKKQAELDLTDLDNSNKKLLESEKKTADERVVLINAVADAQKAASDKRMKMLDDEISAAEKQADYFQQLAANGNINAKESLAEQQRLIVEANKQKEKEMRRQARIELAVSAYNAYQKNVEDPNVKNPLAKTITDITLLSQFIQNIPAFFDGTEDTGKNGQGVDGKGGFHAVLHPNERVVPKSLNEQIGSLSNSELARIASEYNTGALIRKGEGAMQIGGAWQTAAIVGKLDALEKAIKSKPETNIELGEIVGGAMEIVKTTRKGNDVIYNRYRIK